MRILHIIGTLNPAAGGPTESVRMLLGYRDLGYDGEVVTLDDPGAPYLEGIPFPVHALGPQGSVYGFNRKLIPWLRSNRDRFDGIVVNGLWQFTGLAALLCVKRHRPYVVFPHGMLDPYFKRRFPLKHVKKWLYWLPVEYWVLRGAFRVLFTCESEKDLAETSFWLHRWNSYVVPYGTRGPVGSRERTVPAFYEQCPGLRDRRYLLFLGRIDRKKGCDLLIEAFSRTASLDPELQLVMAGPDARHWRRDLEKIAIKAGCEGRIHWPGMLQGDAKWGAIYAAEAFVLPSHQENFGIAVAEALSCGCPVLLSDKVNIAQEIAQADAGYMDADTLAGTEALLRRWIDTPARERAAMSRRAATLFQIRYDMRENAKTIMRLFELALATQDDRSHALTAEAR